MADKNQLAPRPTVVGAETRLLMAECKRPSLPSYTLPGAKRCMQLMDLILRNRLANNPGQFMAPEAKDIIDIMKAPGQFKGFEHYPHYSGEIAQMLQSMIDIANNPHDSRHSSFADFINTAIDVAKSSAVVADPPGGIAVAWKTAGAPSPGGNFLRFETVGGNDFYKIPAPAPVIVPPFWH